VNDHGHVDVVVVGAGFAGLYALHRLRTAGYVTHVFEAAPDVGGTWFWNRYPGARCDIESVDYSYAFSPELDQEWVWTERYAAQPEILAYLGHVADRFDLRKDMSFETRVTSATYEEARSSWLLETDGGDQVRCRFVVLGVGSLSKVNVPQIPGIDSFQGPVLHTARWPGEQVDLAGKTVAVIGTGSSGIQVIPQLAEQADELIVFQRTPNYSFPAQNRPLGPEEIADMKARYPERRKAARSDPSGAPRKIGEKSALEVSPEERRGTLEEHWTAGGTLILQAFYDINRNEEANEHLAEFVRSKIRSIVHDPATAERLCPTGYPVGAKRPCLDSGYFETFNRPDVTLVDLGETPIEEIAPGHIRTSGATFAVDVLVCATGFDAGTGAVLGIEIRGRGGRRLADKWREGPLTYLGLMVSGFPNLFNLAGPGSPSVLAVVPHAIEQHVEWVADLIIHLDEQGDAWAEADLDAELEWTKHVQEVAEPTFYGRADSWYFGANIPGKPRVFLPYIGGMTNYRARCDEVAGVGYEGVSRGR
jgi:cyclohexanone monooxygenase